MPDGLGRPAAKLIVELLNSFTLASLCRHRFIITKNNTHGGGRDSGVSRLNATLKRQTPYSLVSCCIQWFPPWWLSVSHAQRSEAGRQGRRSPHSRASMAWGGSLSLGFLNLSFSFRRALSTSTGSVFPVNFCTPSSLQWRKTDKWSKMKQNLNKTGDVAHIQPRCVKYPNSREAEERVVFKLLSQGWWHCGFIVVISGLQTQSLSVNSAKQMFLLSIQTFGVNKLGFGLRLTITENVSRQFSLCCSPWPSSASP